MKAKLLKYNMKNNNYTVYKHTTPNGKVYIGITEQNPIARWGKDGNGYKNSGIFRYAIKKYGWDNIEHTIIATGLSEQDACIAEKKLIKRYKSRDIRFGYNLLSGGQNGWKGMHHSQEARKNLSFSKLGEKNPMYGKKHTDEWKSLIRRVNSHPKSEETKAKMRIAQSNRSEETRRRLSDAQKKCAVQCVETGVVYPSLVSAADAVSGSVSNLSACLKGRRKTFAGFHWAVVDDVLKAG